jgi:hypothetical protein
MTAADLLRRTSGRVAAGALVIGAALAAAAGPSQAATRPTRPTTDDTRSGAVLQQLQADGAKAIADREAQLQKLSSRLSGAPNCDSTGQVRAEITADEPALTALGTKLAGDTTAADARTDFQSIFQDYRVYLVVTPQAYVTSACGHINQAATTLTNDESTLQARVQAAAAAGADMSAADAALQDLSAKLTSATNEADQANTTLAAIAPDKGDQTVAAANKTAVDQAHTDLTSAHGDLSSALDDAKAVVTALKSAAGH